MDETHQAVAPVVVAMAPVPCDMIKLDALGDAFSRPGGAFGEGRVRAPTERGDKWASVHHVSIVKCPPPTKTPILKN